ncbi:MAG TPA: hypothetical protein DCS11_09240 [Syntrophus sp. (in: bacteria)]|nr:hypothetical protein [Syntrophus sp. (in: bacteria)]
MSVLDQTLHLGVDHIALHGEILDHRLGIHPDPLREFEEVAVGVDPGRAERQRTGLGLPDEPFRRGADAHGLDVALRPVDLALAGHLLDNLRPFRHAHRIGGQARTGIQKQARHQNPHRQHPF